MLRTVKSLRYTSASKEFIGETEIKQYLDLIKTVLEAGSIQENLTGIRKISIPSAMMRSGTSARSPKCLVVHYESYADALQLHTKSNQ